MYVNTWCLFDALRRYTVLLHCLLTLPLEYALTELKGLNDVIIRSLEVLVLPDALLKSFDIVSQSGHLLSKLFRLSLILN
jgi:hypothetical protein